MHVLKRKIVKCVKRGTSPQYENTTLDGGTYSDTFSYDTFGNRVALTHKDFADNTTENTAYTYNSINQLLSKTDSSGTTAYTYDAVGNMTNVTANGQTVKQYTYDDFNRLASATVNGISSAYTYNGDNLRQTKTVNGVTTRHVYDGSDIVVDIGTDTTTFVRGNGLALLKNATTTQLYGIGRRGDVEHLISPSGTDNLYTYTAYGMPTSDNNYIHNPFGYAGEYSDAETGLIYLRNRYYDAEFGIFITQDPIKDGLNWYAYCSGNPVMFVDPLGLQLFLQGAGDEVSAIWSAIKEMTTDDIEMVQQKDANGNLTDSYKVILRNEVNGVCQSGTTLVRRIINSDKKCTVQITNKGNSEVDVNSVNAINGKGSDTNVYFNPDYDPDILTENPTTGNVAPEKRPAFIGLAHEFIHAERSMRGKAIDYEKMADYKYQISRTKIKLGPFSWYKYTYDKENVPKEELATIGLAYNNWWGVDITENMIRAEHGLNLRGAY